MLSTFMQHKSINFPSSRSLLLKLTEYLLLDRLDVTPTTITSSEESLNQSLLTTTTGLTFFPDWSENGKGTRSKSLWVIINTCSKPLHLSYSPTSCSRIFQPGQAIPAFPESQFSPL